MGHGRDLFLAVDDDTYLNWDAIFGAHILIEWGTAVDPDPLRLAHVIRDGSTATVLADDKMARFVSSRWL